MTQYTQRWDCKALDIKGCPSSMVSESNIDSRWIMLTEMHWTISKASVTARIPPFQQAFLSQPDGLGSIQEACVFTGPPSPMFGDVPCFDRGGRLDPIVESWGYWVVALHFQWFYIILSRIRRCCGLIPRSLTAWCERLLKEQGRSWRRTSFITRSPFSVVISTTRSTSQPAGSKKDRREMKREDTADRVVTCAEIRFPFFTARLKMSSWCSCIFMLSQHVQPTTTARSTKSFLVALLALEITSHLRQGSAI